MHFIETIAHQYLDKQASPPTHAPHPHDDSQASASSSSHRASTRRGVDKDDGLPHSPADVELTPHTSPHPLVNGITQHTSSAQHLEVEPKLLDTDSSTPTKPHHHSITIAEPSAHSHSHSHSHSHGGGVDGHTHSILLSGADKTVAAYILEFGLTSHSVIIGITVGVASRTDLNTLLPALCFHQFFEGFALGARLADVGFSMFNEVQLMLIYSLSAPIGIAIGIGIHSTYNQNSDTANLVEGSFDAISAGIILYVGFVQMLAIEFANDYKSLMKHPYKQMALWGGLYLGAAVMAFIGKYL